MRLCVHVRRTDFLRAAVLAVVALSAGACSSLPDMPTVPDWVDPTTWFGSDGGQTPDLASLPEAPQATTPDDQAKVAESLASDRNNAKYSADALRGGTEVAAAPPPDVPVTKAQDEVATASAASSRNRKPAEKTAAPVRTAQVDRSIAQDPRGRAIPGTLPATPPGTQVASIEPPPVMEETPPATVETPAAGPAETFQPSQSTYAAAEPAAPPPPPVYQTAMISPSDAALGFKPSTAPPLDPTVSQFVASPIVQRYQQTAANAGMAYNSAPTAVALNAPKKTRRSRSTAAVGGPEHMGGSVVANLDVLTPSVVANPTPSVYADAQGTPATAVVFFPGDSVYLNATGRSRVQAAVDQFNASGGRGYIRVVGHSSSRTPNMSVERHMAIIFRKSKQRADAVAKQIIRLGVPADRVLVEAVGDSQPVYYESMPKGEEGNRRAEIFVQG